MKKRCEIIPLPDHQFQFLLDGVEKTRWHFGKDYPRPFFYPAIVESGESLTRMGHPGAPNHDHHRSIWFAHHKVFGHDFWADGKGTRIEQTEWLAIEESDEWARFGCRLHWLDGHDPAPLMIQDLLVEFRPAELKNTVENKIADENKREKPESKSAWCLELQSTFSPVAEELELQATNFGFLAIRVSRQIAEFWGGGRLTSSELVSGEKDLFGKTARWMDYSGSQYSHQQGREVEEGVTYIDHPKNYGQPTRWHVREDGWMGASPGMKSDKLLKKSDPTTLRYLLLFHPGLVQAEWSDQLYDNFAKTPPLVATRSKRKHRHYEINRAVK